MALQEDREEARGCWGRGLQEEGEPVGAGQIEGTQDAGQLEPGEPLAAVTALPAINLLLFLNMVFDLA